jgi:hypothetical protein
MEKELFNWVNGLDGWTVKHSQLGFKYKAFLKSQRAPFETGGYAFYHNGWWYPYTGTSLRKAERRFASDLREYHSAA